ncbi:MAG TPA: RagB/SusD family nutrient uptake outer membrane protein [Niabella sp.]
MKNKAQYLLVLSALVILCACSKFGSKDFLDNTDTGVINKDVTFSDSLMTMEFLNGVYRDLSYTYYADNGIYGGGVWGFWDITDESDIRWSGATAQMAPAFNTATFSGASNFSRMKNHWNYCYQNIYRCNLFLENIDKSPISAGTRNRLKGEARFLRAYYYFHLLRLYSGVPIIGDKVFSTTDNFSLPRSSFEETVNYIVQEFNEAGNLLPLTYAQEDYGRPTKGAALALKARVLLMAASPLFNGENPATDEEVKKLTGYVSYDANRWKIAADAAKAVIDLNLYKLVIDNDTRKGNGFYLATTTRKNDEIIFQIMMGASRWYEQFVLPPSRGGENYCALSQQLVDAFPMSNGKAITDPLSGYTESNPYINRDPRFYYTVLYNQALWLDRTSNALQPVNFYTNAPTDGANARSGYMMRKFCNESAGGSYGIVPNIGLIVSRYAEILLDYAEAVNETQGATSEVYKAVEQVRQRAGLDPYQLPADLTKEAMRAAIWNERRIELACEEMHRFFDIKRWKTAEVVMNQPIMGMRWSGPPSSNPTNTRFEVETRTFINPQMYYFPIPLSEINIITDLKQNPGW